MALIARLQPSILPQPCLYSTIRTASRCSTRARPIRPSQLAAFPSNRGIRRTFTTSAAGDCVIIYFCHQQLRLTSGQHTNTLQCEKRNTPKITNGLSSPQMAKPVHKTTLAPPFYSLTHFFPCILSRRIPPLFPRRSSPR